MKKFLFLLITYSHFKVKWILFKLSSELIIIAVLMLSSITIHNILEGHCLVCIKL